MNLCSDQRYFLMIPSIAEPAGAIGIADKEVCRAGAITGQSLIAMDSGGQYQL